MRQQTNFYWPNFDGTSTLVIIKRDGSTVHVLTDTSDVAKAMQHVWHISPQHDSKRPRPEAANEDGRLLGRVLLDAPSDKIVTYDNLNPLDCTRSNMSLGNRSEISKQIWVDYRWIMERGIKLGALKRVADKLPMPS